MAKKAVLIPFTDIERIQIIFGNGCSMAQIKGDADFIMNAGFFNTETGKPVGVLKVDGKVYVKEWNTYGYTWDTTDIRMDLIPDKGGKNCISGVKLLAPDVGPEDELKYEKEVGGYRSRTAIALTENALLLYCSSTVLTPEKLRTELYSQGAKTALMLDSGGSSQCDFKGDCINSSRRVNNYIAVWLKKEENTLKKVVLDPGHGEDEAGKCAPDQSYYEHEFALDMAGRIRAHLERHGVEVYQTRTDTKTITDTKRATMSNEWAPDLFVSLHSNAAGMGESWMTARGYSIYTSSAGETKGRNIAANAILARAKEAGITIWNEGLHHARFTVLVKTNDPAVLIEHLFHDNQEDVALLKDSAYRDKLAEVDAKGILDYLGITWVEDNCVTCPHCGGKLKIAKG